MIWSLLEHALAHVNRPPTDFCQKIRPVYFLLTLVRHGIKELNWMRGTQVHTWPSRMGATNEGPDSMIESSFAKRVHEVDGMTR